MVILDAYRLSLSLKEIGTAQIILISLCISASLFITTILNHTHKQNRSYPQIITLNNHINKQIHEHKTNTWKQHLDKIDHKHNPHFLWGTIAKLSNKKQPTQQSRSIRFGTKTAITDIDKAKAFDKKFANVTPYSTNKINRHINHTIKTLSTGEIRLTTTQVQLAILNSTNNNFTGPDGINIRHLKHIGPFAIFYLTNMYSTALNTNTIPHLWKRATIIFIPKPNKDHNIGTNYRPISLLSPTAKN